MINMLAMRSGNGDLYVNLAVEYLHEHEWGRAYQALLEALNKGGLSDPQRVDKLLQEVGRKLDTGWVGSTDIS